MNCFSNLSSYTAAILARFLSSRRSLCNFPIKLTLPPTLSPRSQFVLARFPSRCCYSSSSSAKKGCKKKVVEPEPVASVMEHEEKDAFFVVRKGDVVGVYNTLVDCQSQVGSSVCDPPVSVYKGYSLSKDTQNYLVSRGLKNALYTIRDADLTEDLFGMLVPCPFKDPASIERATSSNDVSKKRSVEMLELDNVQKVTGMASISEDPFRKQVKLDHIAAAAEPYGNTCLLEFDGASKGNPGKAGAGAILRSTDGSVICRLREGVGIATCNAAEYRAMILGMRYALKKGFSSIRIQGDSKLVCMQIDGSWKVKNENLSTLYKVAKELKDQFSLFQISHVLRNLNSEADAQANLAINLADGQVQEERV
ncbi:hypothetical protein HN51_013634 [Arachis hypogaea]|uniref:RNase H type-1 domain-containing protein n=1 Tax=Arachis hypogaea TaxID=3818 RepID=A0A445DPE0_ARAHY|nr:uncharacterized protein DS421_3g98800 [Arachis hypogaea]RYR65029.1 hypothetical protein Ahy_A03g011027 isoform A [Arachis hypogaea]RYR65030.1 hypothetical protein Ahy_A03g011027 isoform B [Arachis hypogaea]